MEWHSKLRSDDKNEKNLGRFVMFDEWVYLSDRAIVAIYIYIRLRFISQHVEPYCIAAA